jgi:hypothetical protein
MRQLSVLVGNTVGVRVPFELSRAQTDLALGVGFGIKHRLNELVGLQVEGRYFRVLVDNDSTTAGVVRDYDIW